MANQLTAFHVRHVKITEHGIDPVCIVTLSEEGHGFFTLKNRIALYQRIEAFLKKNI